MPATLATYDDLVEHRSQRSAPRGAEECRTRLATRRNRASIGIVQVLISMRRSKRHPGQRGECLDGQVGWPDDVLFPQSVLALANGFATSLSSGPADLFSGGAEDVNTAGRNLEWRLAGNRGARHEIERKLHEQWIGRCAINAERSFSSLSGLQQRFLHAQRRFPLRQSDDLLPRGSRGERLAHSPLQPDGRLRFDREVSKTSPSFRSPKPSGSSLDQQSRKKNQASWFDANAMS